MKLTDQINKVLKERYDFFLRGMYFVGNDGYHFF